MSTYTYDPDEVEHDDEGYAKALPTERCQNYPSAECAGDTWPRTSRSGLTHSLKCDACQEALDQALDAINERYPDTPHAPSWFDPTYAGERWNEED